MKALLHAARELLDALVRALGEADPLEQRLRATLHLEGGEPVERAPVLEVLARSQARVETTLAAEDDSD